MKDYEAKGNCHIFLNADSCEQLLTAIADWWAGISEDSKVIEAITFTPDNDGVNAGVFWTYLRAEQKKVLDEMVATPQPLLVDAQDIPEN